MTAAIRPALRFRPDGTSYIVQITDVHWREGGPEDQRSRALLEMVLDSERPDLVAITGDLIERPIYGDLDSTRILGPPSGNMH